MIFFKSWTLHTTSSRRNWSGAVSLNNDVSDWRIKREKRSFSVKQRQGLNFKMRVKRLVARAAAGVERKDIKPGKGMSVAWEDVGKVHSRVSGFIRLRMTGRKKKQRVTCVGWGSCQPAWAVGNDAGQREKGRRAKGAKKKWDEQAAVYHQLSSAMHVR